MRKRIFKTITEFCPVTNCENTVELEYLEIPVLNSLREHYKAVSVDCPHIDECMEGNCHIRKNHISIEI